MLAARRAGLHELGAVQAITRHAYRQYVDELGFMPMPMTEDYAPRLAAGEVWMVSRGDADVALAVLQPASDHLVIYSLAVLPSEQGSGVGPGQSGKGLSTYISVATRERVTILPRFVALNVSITIAFKALKASQTGKDGLHPIALGVGRWMLDFAAERARCLGLPGLRLFTNALMARNMQIYRQAGFHEVGRRPNPYRPGFMLVDMARAL